LEEDEMRSLLRALLILAALAVPCESALAQSQIQVVASFSILADIAAAIGGERVSVAALVPPDGDAHVYQPTPADGRALTQARLVVVNGLGMEGWIDRLIRASGFKGPVVVASKGVKPGVMNEDESDAVSKAPRHMVTPKVIFDPHAWQDARNGILYARNIADGLARVDPAGAAVYRSNAEAYVKELEATDAWIRREIGRIPPQQRKIITTHDAFGYFGRAYGVAILAAEGISTEYEPSAGDVAKLIRQIRTEKIKALFIENMHDSRIIEQIARDTGAVIAGTVYSDALSPPGGPADTYLKMFRHNVPLFVAAMAKN
jgi:zinc/manganese transport system substrate-binding protein